MIKAVLFDMDGVLAFTEQFYTQRRLDFFAENGILLPDVPDWTGKNDISIWEECVPDTVLRERLKAGYRSYVVDHPTPWERLANDQAHATMSLLKSLGCKVAICSSSWRSLIDEYVSQLMLDDFIDYTVSGAECLEYKPEPDIYLNAMSRLGVDSSEAIVVEDSPVGICAGKAARAFVCALRQPPGIALEQAAADVVIDELIDVVELVRAANDLMGAEA